VLAFSSASYFLGFQKPENSFPHVGKKTHSFHTCAQKRRDTTTHNKTMTTTTTENNASEEERPPPPFPPSEKWTIGEPNTPYELNTDNTAKDPVAFRDALLRDEEKRPEIEKEKDLAVHLLGEDVGKFQECLKDFIGKVSSSSSSSSSSAAANVVLFCFVLRRRRRRLRCGPRL